MTIHQAMHVIKHALDNVEAIELREFLDDIYHDFFSEVGARDAIANFFRDRFGSECVLMIEGQEDELVKAVRI